MLIFGVGISLCLSFEFVFGETINRDLANDNSAVSCLSFPCIINCNEEGSCRETTLSCPLSGSGGDCTINIFERNGAYKSIINTGSSDNIEFNLNGQYSMKECIINGYTKIGAKLTINAPADDTLQKTILYAPYGENSELNINCGTGDNQNEYYCERMNIYIDYSTKVNLNGNSKYAYYLTKIKNIFSDSNLNINKDSSIDVNYRGSVTLRGLQYQSFKEFEFYGNGQSDYKFESYANEAFINSKIFDSGNSFNSFSNLIFLTNSGADKCFRSMELTLNGIISSNLIIDIDDSDSYDTFIYSKINIDGINGDFKLINSAQRAAFREIELNINGNINGDFEILDKSIDGEGVYDSKISVNGNIAGNVLISDVTTGIGGGDSFYSSEFILSYPDGNIGGNVEFIENSVRGESFDNAIYKIGNVAGNLLFESAINDKDNYGSFRASNFDITSVGKDLSLLSGTIRSFKDIIFNVNGNIGGSFNMIDTSNKGQMGRSSIISINGNIGGSVSIKDLSTDSSAAGDDSFYLAKFYLSNVPNNNNNNYGIISGNVEFIEDSPGDGSFDRCDIYIGNVEGNVLFKAEPNINPTSSDGAFTATKFRINNINGDLLLISNKKRTFRTIDFSVSQAIFGDTYLIGSVNQDFHSANIDFGNANLIDIRITGSDSLHNTKFVATNSAEIILTCDNDGDCSEVNIYCPDDNKQNKCRVYCSLQANCDDIDLYTTNGYCLDASINCIGNEANSISNCNIPESSQIFCSVGSTYQYGDGSRYCKMKKDNNINKYYCYDSYNNCGDTDGLCELNTPTPPINFPKCTVENDIYNVAIIFDESGSVQRDNYKKSIDFIIDFIKYDINPNSKISALAFGTDNDIIYTFNQIQNDNRNNIISALIEEKSNYASTYTDTYNALLTGIQLFKNNNNNINPSDNNIMFLITDGQPKCHINDPQCQSNICTLENIKTNILNGLNQADIQLYILGIANIDMTEIKCLVEDENTDIYKMNSFTSQEFKSIEQEFRKIVCPQQPILDGKTVDIGIIDTYSHTHSHHHHYTHFLYQLLFINILIAITTTTICYAIYYFCNKNKNKNKNNYPQKYEKVNKIDDNL